MGKLLTALKRIEARGGVARQPEAPPAAVAESPGDFPASPDWPPLATLAWPEWTSEASPHDDSQIWPVTEIDDPPTLVEAESTADETELLPVEDADIVADWSGTPEPVEAAGDVEEAVESPPLDQGEVAQPLPNPSDAVEEESYPEPEQSELAAVALPTAEPATGGVTDEPPATLRLPGFGRPLGHDGPEDLALPGIGRSDVVPFLPPSHRPYREACESILAALDTSRRQAVLLAWCDDDLDHSPLCVRLAQGLADRLDDPVLVIDVSQRRRLSTLLRVPAETSLSDALSGQVSWRDQIVQTGTAGLCALPSAAGDFGTDPVSVARLIEGCKEAFALLLIVGGPVSALPDSLLAACDAAVLLVEAQHTAQTAAASQIQRLHRSGTEVAGCLLTGSP